MPGHATIDDDSVAAADCIRVAQLPSNLTIAPPADNVPPEYARFLGVWGNGKWNDRLCHTLVVEKVDAAGNVLVIHSSGRLYDWNISNPSYFRAGGTIKDGKITFLPFASGATVTYWLDGGRLKGSYILPHFESKITLSKIQ